MLTVSHGKLVEFLNALLESIQPSQEMKRYEERPVPGALSSVLLSVQHHRQTPPPWSHEDLQQGLLRQGEILTDSDQRCG